MASKKKAGATSRSGTGKNTLRGAVTSAVGTDALLDLVERFGLVDMVIGRIKSRIEETDLDDLMDEVADYLKRNPEVLVVTLGAATVATGALVWLNSRREWDGSERRGVAKKTSSRASASYDVDDEDEDEVVPVTASRTRKAS